MEYICDGHLLGFFRLSGLFRTMSVHNIISGKQGTGKEGKDGKRMERMRYRSKLKPFCIFGEGRRGRKGREGGRRSGHGG